MEAFKLTFDPSRDLAQINKYNFYFAGSKATSFTLLPMVTVTQIVIFMSEWYWVYEWSFSFVLVL